MGLQLQTQPTIYLGGLSAKDYTFYSDTGQIVSLSSININANDILAENILVTSLTALSTIINVLDIKMYEMSGFNIIGNVNIDGNLNTLLLSAKSIDSNLGYRFNGTAPDGYFLKGNGSYFEPYQITFDDLPPGEPFTANSDTNIILTLSGAKNSALLSAVSLNVYWDGILPLVRGGTNSDNGSITGSSNLFFAATGDNEIFLRGKEINLENDTFITKNLTVSNTAKASHFLVDNTPSTVMGVEYRINAGPYPINADYYRASNNPSSLLFTVDNGPALYQEGIPGQGGIFSLAWQNGLFPNSLRIYNDSTNFDNNYQRALLAWSRMRGNASLSGTSFIVGTQYATPSINTLSSWSIPIILAPGYNQSLSASAPVILQQTWGRGATLFTLLSSNVTDIASSTDSKLIDFNVNGLSRFNIEKTGNVNTAGSIMSDTFINSVQGYRFNSTAPDGFVLRGNGNNFISSRLSALDIAAGQALIKNDDSNIVLNLEGNPTESLLKTVTMTLSWVNVLPISRGGTGTDNGSISGSSDLIFSAGQSNKDVVLLPSGTGSTITSKLSTNIGTFNEIFVTSLTAISATTQVIDIKQFELSGFNITGNVSISGDLFVDDITSNNIITGRNLDLKTISVSSVLFTGETVLSPAQVTASDLYLKVVVNGENKYLRFFDFQ